MRGQEVLEDDNEALARQINLPHEGSGVYKSTDGGATWVDQPSP